MYETRNYAKSWNPYLHNRGSMLSGEWLMDPKWNKTDQMAH